MGQKIAIGIITILVLILGFYLVEKQDNGAFEGTKVIERVTQAQSVSNSDFLFETVQGQEIAMNVEDRFFHVNGMEDKTIFLKVFGWDCKYCKKEIPELVKLKRELGDAFEVIAVEAQQFSNEESLKYIEQYGINYPIVPGELQTEFYAYLQEKYGWSGVIPLTIVLAKGGEVLAFEIGAKSYSLAELMKASLLRN